MGLFGRGMAFNNQFIPRPVFGRRHPLPPPPMMGGPSYGSSLFINESFTYKTNGWDAVIAGFQTLPFIASMWGRDSYRPQGDARLQQNVSNGLENLNAFWGSKYTIRTEANGQYTAVDKNGKIVASGDYETVKAKLSSLADESDDDATTPENLAKKHDPVLEKKDGKWVEKDNPDKEWTFDSKNNCFIPKAATTSVQEQEEPEQALAQKQEADAKAKGLTKQGDKYYKDGIEYYWKNDTEGWQPKEPEQDPSEDPGSAVGAGGSGSGHVSSSGRRDVSPKGYYRAAKNDEDGQAVLNAIRPGMSARQVTDIILNNKMNYLGGNERNALASEIERKNPSIFRNGKVIENFPKDKLDIPTIEHIKKNFTKDTSGMKSSNANGGTRGATGTYTGKDGNEVKVEETVTSKTGRYAKKINGKWHYYAKDGSELNEDYIRKNDPDLWTKSISKNVRV